MYYTQGLSIFLELSFSKSGGFHDRLHIKKGLYRIWCGVNRLGDSGVHTLGDTSAFVYPAGQLLLTRRGKTRMDGIGIVFEFYVAPLVSCVMIEL